MRKTSPKRPVTSQPAYGSAKSSGLAMVVDAPPVAAGFAVPEAEADAVPEAACEVVLIACDVADADADVAEEGKAEEESCAATRETSPSARGSIVDAIVLGVSV